MSVRVITAVTGEDWEPALVCALEAASGVTLVRRCVDLADLLATAAAGGGGAALIGARLRRLDRDALGRLATAGVAVVGMVAPGDEDAERRLRQLGVGEVLAADLPVERIVSVLTGAAASGRSGAVATRSDQQPPGPARGGGPSAPYGDPRADAARPPTDAPAGRGRLIAVWGPTGAPGRTTVAVNLAAESARAGRSTMLVDADVYGGVVAQMLGLLDEAPGLAAAARAANNGTLDLPRLAGLAPVVAPRLRVLTGIPSADRWPELRPAALDAVYALARGLAAVTVVDCGFSVEQDEELAYDTAAPRRNGATLTTLQLADTVVAVGAGDPVGVQRLVRALATLRDVVPGAAPVVVVNKVRKGAVGADPERQLAAALHRYAAVQEIVVVPYDRAVLDRLLLQGRTLAEGAAGSPVRAALAVLAARVTAPAAARVPARRRGSLMRRRAAAAR